MVLPPEQIPGPVCLPLIGTLYKYLPLGKGNVYLPKLLLKYYSVGSACLGGDHIILFEKCTTYLGNRTFFKIDGKHEIRKKLLKSIAIIS